MITKTRAALENPDIHRRNADNFLDFYAQRARQQGMSLSDLEQAAAKEHRKLQAVPVVHVTTEESVFLIE